MSDAVSSLRRCNSDNLGSAASRAFDGLDIRCPITKEIPLDPVVAADGFTYERRAIERWLEIHGTSPISRRPLLHTHLVANTVLCDAARQLRFEGRGVSLVPRCTITLPSRLDVWRSHSARAYQRVASGVTLTGSPIGRSSLTGIEKWWLTTFTAAIAAVVAGGIVHAVVPAHPGHTAIHDSHLRVHEGRAWWQAGTQLQALCRGLPVAQPIFDVTQNAACDWLANMTLPRPCRRGGIGALTSCGSLTGTQLQHNPTQDLSSAVLSQAYALAVVAGKMPSYAALATWFGAAVGGMGAAVYLAI